MLAYVDIAYSWGANTLDALHVPGYIKNADRDHYYTHIMFAFLLAPGNVADIALLWSTIGDYNVGIPGSTD